eukprot:CAMPEP_0172826128 /NCGR_PEP_ID=MMETSP1075-20121228/19194_1 /TAXON_ID=2916 /ORGANISM="Ceratium fusus, Strain PA161109" /LENGTH=102 /DNA_ID=CAMNT_0013667707 /DNA_START=99 /DNA_END=405 /DNA_ORIENTATION=-
MVPADCAMLPQKQWLWHQRQQYELIGSGPANNGCGKRLDLCDQFQLAFEGLQPKCDRENKKHGEEDKAAIRCALHSPCSLANLDVGQLCHVSVKDLLDECEN